MSEQLRVYNAQVNHLVKSCSAYSVESGTQIGTKGTLLFKISLVRTLIDNIIVSIITYCLKVVKYETVQFLL